MKWYFLWVAVCACRVVRAGLMEKEEVNNTECGKDERNEEVECKKSGEGCTSHCKASSDSFY